MKPSVCFKIAVAMAVAGFSQASIADNERVEVQIDAGAGVQSDSNVGIADIDNNTGERDSAVLLNGGFGANVRATKYLAFSAGYDYSQTRYRTFSEFDLDLHHAVAAVSLDTRIVNAAVTAERFDARLDGEDYLSVEQFSPSIARLFGDRLFVRGAYINMDKRYDEITARDARVEAYRLDAYLLFDAMNHYVALGLQAGDEDALDDEFDFKGRQATATWGYVAYLPLVEVRLKAKLRIEERDYLNLAESAEAPRFDRRTSTSLSAEIPFSQHVSLEAIAQRVDNDSNVEAGALDKQVYGLMLAVSF